MQVLSFSSLNLSPSAADPNLSVDFASSLQQHSRRGEETDAIQKVDAWATSVVDCWCGDSALPEVVSRRSARLQLSVEFRGESRCSRPPWGVTSLLTGKEFRTLAFRRTLYFDLYVRALRAFSVIYQLVFSTLLLRRGARTKRLICWAVSVLLLLLLLLLLHHQAESTVRRMS